MEGIFFFDDLGSTLLTISLINIYKENISVQGIEMGTWLKWVLKFYPASFKEKMGEAWLETAQAVWEQHAQKNWIAQSILAFEMMATSVFWAAPQAHYYHWISLMKAPEEQAALQSVGQGNALALLRAHTPKPFKKMGVFFLMVAVFWILAFVSALGFFASSQLYGDTPNPLIFPSAVVVVIVAVILNFDRLKQLWITHGKPRHSIIWGIFLGTMSAGLFALFGQLNIVTVQAERVFEEYSAVRESFQFYKQDPKTLSSQDLPLPWIATQRQWFTDDGDFLEGKQQAWCNQANNKMDFWIAQNNSTTLDPIKIMLMQGTLNTIYRKGCLSDGKYRETFNHLSQKARTGNILAFPSLADINRVDPPKTHTRFYDNPILLRSIPFFSKAMGASAYLSQKHVILTPQAYCFTALSKIMSEEKLEGKTDLQKNIAFCEAKPNAVSLSEPQHWWEYLFFTRTAEEREIAHFDQAPRVDEAQMKAIQDEIRTLLHHTLKPQASAMKDTTP